MAGDCPEEGLIMHPDDDHGPRAQLSIIDRLLDDEPKNRQEAPLTRAQTVRKAREALRRDLEWLLNTRAFPEEIEEELEHTNASVFTYGVPDFSACSATAAQTRVRLELALQRALELFEPRLSGVTVEAAPPDKGDRGILRFVISGWFHLPPVPLQVSFETRLELTRGQYRVSSE
jgi:type VI secretion system protein ImpF